MQDGVAYPVATVTPGISALQRQRPLGLRSPDTAWDRRHRLRKGRGHDARSSRAGLIAADEPFLGGPAKGTKGRRVATAAPTRRGGGACRSGDKQGKQRERAGRHRLTLLPDATAASPGTWLTHTVKTKSRIRPEGWTGDSEAALEEDLPPVRIVGSPPLAPNRVPQSHQVFGPLNPWLNGTPHGVAPKELPSDVDECGFRFNRRERPMAALQTRRGISLQKKPLTLENLRG
jgi:hypothetical protein